METVSALKSTFPQGGTNDVHLGYQSLCGGRGVAGWHTPWEGAEGLRTGSTETNYVACHAPETGLPCLRVTWREGVISWGQPLGPKCRAAHDQVDWAKLQVSTSTLKGWKQRPAPECSGTGIARTRT